MELLDFVFEIGRRSLEGFWVPLLVWTIVALPVFLVVRCAEAVPTHVRYYASLSTLAALPLGLVAGIFFIVEPTLVRDVAAVVTLPAIETSTQADPAARSFVWTAYHTAGAATLVAALLACWRLGLLLIAFGRLRHFRRSVATDAPGSLVADAARLRRHLGITRDVQVALSDSTASPLTFGYRQPLILVPRRLLDSADDLQLALLHEMVHVKRRDYLCHWFEQVLGAVFVVHPLVAMLRQDISVLREITCDADVLAHSDNRPRYARLLVRYSTVSDADLSMAVGIRFREHHLKKRIRSMKNLLDFSTLNRSKRTGFVVSTLLLTVAMLAVACSDLLVHPTPRSDAAPVVEKQATDAETFVVVEDMPKLVGGLASIQKNLVYPEEAKEAGIEGRVIVQFIVDEEGDVVDPRIVRGITPRLDEASLDAVRTAQFEPGRQDGQPVKVKMSLPITFKLGGGDTPTRATPPTPPPPPNNGAEDIIRLVLDGNNNLYLEGRRVDVASLASELRKAGLSATTVVSLRVDGNASMGVTSDVQKEIRNAGARRINYRTQ